MRRSSLFASALLLSVGGVIIGCDEQEKPKVFTPKVENLPASTPEINEVGRLLSERKFDEAEAKLNELDKTAPANTSTVREAMRRQLEEARKNASTTQPAAPATMPMP